ncbi:nuclear transport factor 2 family protein [Maribacter sp. 2307UL18-2]|uniref:nuclear transport factor 2 family protein n=1 Tax=Maribacter sp. 2307UL18-2 TaxID=3386274 RepID=UPI0039BD0541
MNRIILMGIFALFMSAGCNAQSSDEKAIKETIIAFSKAGDKNDADKLATYLDDNYRIIMNRLFGSSDVSVMNKDTYLEKIKTKEYGGDNRKVEIETIVLNGSNASAKVSFIGSKMTFISTIILIKDEKNGWQLVSDVPVVK